MNKEISPNKLLGNPFELIGTDWMLVTTGNETQCNTMTASWGQMGIMWNKPVVNVYIRPQRFTREYMDANDRFSLNFFEPGTHRQELGLLGTKSGRDCDKIAMANLSVERMDGVPVISESTLVMVCKKLYQQDLGAEGFLDKNLIDASYAAGDYHRMYIAEIEKIYLR